MADLFVDWSFYFMSWLFGILVDKLVWFILFSDLMFDEEEEEEELVEEVDVVAEEEDEDETVEEVKKVGEDDKTDWGFGRIIFESAFTC